MTVPALTDAGALREALAIEDDAFHHEYRKALTTGDMDGAARALSGRLRQMDKRAKAANARADRAEAALKDFVSVFEGVDTALSLAQECAYLRAVDFLDGAPDALARATTDADLAKARGDANRVREVMLRFGLRAIRREAQVRSALAKARDRIAGLEAELSKRPPKPEPGHQCPKCGITRGMFPACAQEGCPTLNSNGQPMKLGGDRGEN